MEITIFQLIYCAMWVNLFGERHARTLLVFTMDPIPTAGNRLEISFVLSNIKRVCLSLQMSMLTLQMKLCQQVNWIRKKVLKAYISMLLTPVSPHQSFISTMKFVYIKL